MRVVNPPVPATVAASACSRHPRSSPHRAKVSRLALVGLAFLLVICSATAEERPVRVYTTADGLPSNTVTCNKRDSHGFVWFCTEEGLSRFDGYTFTNYGVEQGLPDRVVTDFLETSSGDYLVGTAKGLARFDPKPDLKQPMFIGIGKGTERTKVINELLEDRQGRVWVAIGDSGVLQATRERGQWVLHDPGLHSFQERAVEGFLEDVEGNLWIRVFLGAGGAQLWRRTPSGQLKQFPDEFLTRGCGSLAGNRILSMREDRDHNIWLGTYCGLALLVSRPRAGGRVIERVFSRWDRRMGPDSAVGGIFQSSDGRLFVGTGVAGTFEIHGDPRAGNVHFEFYSAIGDISLEDGSYFWHHNQRIPRNAFEDYRRSDGLATIDIRAVFEGIDGQLYVVTGLHNRFIHRLDGKRFIAVVPHVPGHVESWDWNGWGWGQTHLQDHRGEWWFATGVGLLRYPKVKRLEDLAVTSPKAIYRNPSDIFRLYEDSHGDIWIAGWRGSRLTRWLRSTEQFQDFGAAWDGEATAFREDRAGNLWIGRWGGGLARYRRGQFTWVIDPHGTPPGTVISLFLDHAGRMWAGSTRSGLIRIDDPNAESVRFTVYSTKQGLASNDVRAITEDHFGRIYFWTGRSVDRLNPETGVVRHYTEADGLVSTGSDHNVAFCDRHGTLWFGLDGLSRLQPEPDVPSQPPTIRVTKVSIQGVEHHVSELGEANVAGLVLQPHENQIQIDFASLNFTAGEDIQYQYKLDGTGSEWSAPVSLRTVNFPRLSVGTYKFLVRAVNSDGLVSSTSASVSWQILPPLWRRWWSLTGFALLVAVSVHAAYRYRLQRLLELERVRTRIATDLHDDIGSSLTQIAIMSELAGRNRDDGRSTERLARIADLSRELVDSMSDIVWAINPKRDHLSDLIQRMRHFATEVLEAAGIEVGFRTELVRADASLKADVRREVFLVFKESLNNIVRHAQCKRVDIHVNLQGAQVVLKVCDDGLGFCDQQENGRGHGLASMRARAQRLGGNLEVSSEPGRGATVVLSVPVSRSAYSHD